MHGCYVLDPVQDRVPWDRHPAVVRYFADTESLFARLGYLSSGCQSDRGGKVRTRTLSASAWNESLFLRFDRVGVHYPRKAFCEGATHAPKKHSLKLYEEVESVSCPCVISESETDDERIAYGSEDREAFCFRSSSVHMLKSPNSLMRS